MEGPPQQHVCQGSCGGLRAHLARSPCHPTPSRCLCPGNSSPGHTKRQITMIAGASTGEWLRGPMHFGFGVLGTHKKSSCRLSPDEVAPSSRNVNPRIFARRRTPRTAGGNPSIMAAIPTRPCCSCNPLFRPMHDFQGDKRNHGTCT